MQNFKSKILVTICFCCDKILQESEVNFLAFVYFGSFLQAKIKIPLKKNTINLFI